MRASYFERDAVGVLGGQILMVPNPCTVETINYACAAYGFLIERNEKITTRQFAERIAKNYDCEGDPQNRAVILALSACV